MHSDDTIQISGDTPRRREKLGFGALTISIFVHAIFILLAIFFFIKWVYPPTPPLDFLPGGGGGGGNNGETVNKVQTQMRRASMAASAKRVAVEGEASFTLPDTSTEMMDPGLPMDAADPGKGSGGGFGGGHGGGQGSGIGTGSGPGVGPGHNAGFNLTTSPFGSKETTVGALEGHFYDFKQDEKGQPVKFDTASVEDYTSRVIKLDEGRFKDTAFKKYYRAPDTLYLTELAVKNSPASAGPGYFGAGDKVQPSGWVAHYHGTIKAPKDMSFRFVGAGDDYLFVRAKGRVRLVACVPDIQGIVAGKWQAEDTGEQWPSPIGGYPLVKGDWMLVKKGESFDIDIAVGERPGGYVGFVLFVQEKGVNYQQANNGGLALPLFAIQAFNDKTRERIKGDFPDWQFEWENVPVFGSQTDVNPFR